MKKEKKKKKGNNEEAPGWSVLIMSTHFPNEYIFKIKALRAGGSILYLPCSEASLFEQPLSSPATGSVEPCPSVSNPSESFSEWHPKLGMSG